MMQRLFQLALDLFDSKEPDEIVPTISRVGLSTSPTPSNDRISSQPLVSPGRGTHEPLDRLIEPMTFRHPRASREIVLDDCLVAYEFVRRKRRTIGFVVGAEGLSVRAPKWTPVYEVESAIREKSEWIRRKLDETRERHEKLESSRIVWKDGAIFNFLGEPVKIVLDSRQTRSGTGAVLQPATDASPGAPMLLHMALATAATPDQIRDSVQAWLMRQAKRIFVERLDRFSPELSVKWTRLSLSNAGTRWGSASADGSIRLNWRLVHFTMPVIDYVVVHELSHLRVMDHSPRFWETVKSVVPDYTELRARLKDEPIPKW